MHENYKACKELKTGSNLMIEPRHEISNNVVCATSKGSDQPAHMRSLIRAFASRLNILLLLGYCPIIIWDFYALKEAVQARLSLHFSKCHIGGNHMSWLIYVPDFLIRSLETISFVILSI